MRRSWILRAFVAAAAASCGGDTPTGPPPAPVPTQLSISTQPGASVPNGAALNPQPAVRLRDAQGVPAAVSGVAVAVQLTGGGAALGGTTTATTNSSGIATFSGLTLTGTVGSYTLQFTSGSLTAADANPVTLTPGAPTALALAVAPSTTAQAGAALAQQPQVRLKDQSGNDAMGASVTVTASLVSGTVALANATAVTNAAGLAAFSGLALAGATGSYTLRFTAPGLTTVDAAAPTVLAAGPPTQLVVTTQPSATLLSGATFATQPAIALRDAFGNVAAQVGTAVTAEIVTGTGTLSGTTTVTTDSLGRAAFSNLGIAGTAGNFTLRFSATGVTSVVSNTIAVAAGTATRVRITTAPQIGATNGVALATQPVVQIQDNSGNVVAGAGVVVTAGIIATGGGALPTITNGTATTDATGKATFSGLTLTGLAATYLLTVSAPGLGADTTQTPIFLQAGAATKLTLAQQPGSPAVNGQRLSVPPAVRLQDASGNNVSQSNVTVTAALVSGTATLTHASKPTNASGVAVFDSLAITGTVGSYKLRFSAPGMADVDSSQAIILVTGAASQLALTTPPSATAQSGVALATQPVVQLRDTGGNAVAQSGVTVTAKVVGGGATVTNATAITGVAGAATFAGLTLTGSVGSYVLRFMAPNLDSVDAAAATVISSGPPASLTIVTPPPGAATSGVPLATAPVVEVLDGAGNPVTGVTVGATAGGNVTLAGNQATTGGAGRATFTGLTLTGLVSGYNLQFCVGANCASASLLAASPFPTSLGAGGPATLTLTTPPSADGQSGITLLQQPVAVVRDASGNAVPGVTVSASATAASVALGSALTDASGTATFAGLTVSGAPAGYTLQFAAGSATASSALALSAGPPATVTLTPAPSATATSGIVFAQQPIVLVRDATGNGVPGGAVTVTASGGAVVLGDSAVTDGSGNATFSGLALSGSVTTYTLTFTGGSVSTSAQVTLSSGPAAAVSVTQQPSTTAVNGAALAQQPIVLVRDLSTNPVQGAVVTASLTTPGAAVSHATAVTDAAGLATFSGLSLFGSVGNYTLRFSVNGLLPVPAVAPTSLAAGSAAKLAIATQPSTSVQNTAALATQPVIQITDAGGNQVSQSGTTITASIPGGGPSLTGATALSSGAGAATFSGLTMTGVVGNYRLRFSAPNLTSVDAAAATVLQPGPPTHLMLTTQPSASTPANVVMARQPVAQLRDVSHNNVGQSGVPVTLASTSGALTLAGTTTVNTDLSGAASFTDVVATGPRGTHMLRFTSTSPAFAVNAMDSTIVAVPLSISVPVTDSGGFDTEHPYVVSTLPTDTLLVVSIAGGTGTADLYVRRGAAPDPGQGLFDCFPRLAGSNETCRFRNPAPGNWYVTIVGFPFSYSGVTLTVNTYP